MIQTRKLAIALVLGTFTPVLLGGGCGGGSSQRIKDAGAGHDGSAAGSGGAGSGGAGSGGAGSGGAGAGGEAGADAAAGTGVAGSDAAAGTGADASPDVEIEAPPPPMPDPTQAKSWLFDTSAVGIDGWHYTAYGSSPDFKPGAGNLAMIAGAPVWDGTNDADNKTTSGSLKGTIPFAHENEQIDFQAFSVGAGMYNWYGFTLSAKVKLLSGGNINPNCPLQAWLYVSQAPDYNTVISPKTNLEAGKWITLTFDMADAAINVMSISQMGIQINTGTGCTAAPPDGGADGGASDAAPTEGGASDASADGGASDAAATEGGASDAGTDLLVDAGLGDVIDAPATDADIDAVVADGGVDASDDASDAAPPPPVTATTTVILIDSVIAKVK